MSEQHLPAVYKKVLVIDDNYVDRYIAERNIKKYGFAEEVVLKDSAKSALEYLSSLASAPDNLPNLIFLDIRMPETDGFGFLEQYEKLSQEVKRNCIIIMLSTSLSPMDQEKAATNKFVSKFMNKPLNKEAMGNLMNATPLNSASH